MEINKIYPLFSLFLLLLILAIVDLSLGSVSIAISEIFNTLLGLNVVNDTTEIILWQSRFPQTMTALFVGGALAVSGLQMQTLFRNALAGPSVLGISSGASLGVALVIMTFSFLEIPLNGIYNKFITTFSAIIGAGSVLLIIVLLSNKIRSNVTLLVLGLMFGYISSAAISVLQFYTSQEKLQAYVFWGLGSFSNVTNSILPILIIGISIMVILSFLVSKPLDAFLLGEEYAMSLGVDVMKMRIIIITLAGILVGISTAFCGPIAFLGLAVPHLTRSLFFGANHKLLIPAVFFSGASLALFCDIIAKLPGSEGTLPINAITSIIGAPIVIWVILKK